MASIQRDASGNFHIRFRFGGQQFRRSLQTKHRRKAEASASHIEENIRLVNEGRLTLPPGADVTTYLLSDGRLDVPVRVVPVLRIGQLFERYARSIPRDTLEATSICTVKVHMGHVTRLIGSRTLVNSVTKSELQEYVTARSEEPGRRGCVSPTTIRKELGTFGALWNWAKTEGYVETDFPRNGLLFPKQTDKLPFQTWEQIARQIRDQELTVFDALPLWECLYLNRTQVEKLLRFVKDNSRHPFVYPMCAIAAYTGARRSEICRSHTSDIDLVGSTFTIRERKRSRAHRTTRTVPISDSLGDALEESLSRNPSSRYAFPENHRALRLEKSARDRNGMKPFEASNFLNAVLSGSVWEPLRGWHVFRHSFISNCASSGVDQRFIDAWVGHQTEEQRLRYRHLFPDSQIKAINSVFSRRK
ncbi:MAG: tyrosine-type recombinase/integrase [Fuerstiella sp.]|nr:tyrosine-type recombinase/integrase [Fuerstiella sp.]